MPPRRYTLIIADRTTGVVRRATISLRPTLGLILGILALPILIGLGARWSAMAEIGHLTATTGALELENANYRAATGALTTQIASLQAAIDEIAERATLDAATQTAVERLPSVVRSRATGGTDQPAVSASLLAATFTSPENTFGVLRDLLGVLEDRLQSVRYGVERRRALAEATPSIWPAHGWLSGTFGNRRDPFTGDVSFHPALDISAEKGTPIFATAAGVVRVAAFNGAYGNMIEIDHGFGLVTRYAHLSRFAAAAGDRVIRGDVIGYMGATGRVTGTHVHYEVWANGRPINPLQLLVARP